MQLADTSVPVLVLVASRSPLLHGALGVVRSLGRLGVPVYLARDEGPSPTDSSHYLHGTFTVAFDPARPKPFLDDLLEVGGRIGRRSVLVPIDDLGALFLVDHAEPLRRWFLFPDQAPELSHSLASKKELYLLCKRLDVPTPETAFPRARDQVLSFAERAQFPVVVKAIDPLLLHQREQARSVVIARDAEALLDAYDRMEVPEQPNLMLQEYIPGGAESIWMFNGYLDHRSRCLVGFTGVKLRQCLPHTGQTSLGICRHNPVIQEATEEFLASVGYRGIVDLGWRYDARDGRYKLLDVNPRIGATFRLFVGTNGMDVARALYLDLTGQPVPASSTPDGRKWLVEQTDLHASVLYRAEGSLTARQWLRSFHGVQETAWFARDDPAPFLRMCRSFLGMIARRAAQASRARIPPPRRTATVRIGGADSSPEATKQQLVTARFETHARFWEEVYRGRDPFSVIHQHRLALALDCIDRLNLPGGARVLEVGSGAGLAAVGLARRGFQVDTVDTAAAMLEAVRRHAADAGATTHLRVILADAQRLPFRSATFDIVLALGVVPWLHSPDQAAKEMARVLRTGGHLVLNADNRARLNRLLDPLHSPPLEPVRRAAKAALATVHLWQPRQHPVVTYHSLAEFDRIVAAAGLERVTGMTFGYGPFSLFGRTVLPDKLGVEANRLLQRLADRGVPVLRRTGAQYLVVARRPVPNAAGPAEDTEVGWRAASR
jgi:predicted ATP-grasp superfamily ATP-dependent carboligase/ubiquinone/menaquinone biosynthesis C-methylase UbiE